MLELLDPGVVSRASEWAQCFAAAQPFRHAIIDGFLTADFCEKLIGEFPAFDKQYAINEHGEIGRKAAVPDIASLGPAYQKFDALMRDRPFLDLMGKIASIEALRL